MLVETSIREPEPVDSVPDPFVAPVPAADALELFRRDLRQIPPLTAAEERVLARRASGGDRAAQNRLVEGILPMILATAARHHHDHLSTGDLLQEGALGAREAAAGFDPTHGVRFVTYARWPVQRAMTRAIAERGRAVRLPAHIVEKRTRAMQAEEELGRRLGRTPRADEVADAAGITSEDVQWHEAYTKQPVSLDASFLEDGPTLRDLLVDPDAEDAYVYIEFHEALEMLDAAVHSLHGREREVIDMRYDPRQLPGEGATLEQVGIVLGLTRERIRQIEAQALDKLRQLLEGKEIEAVFA